MQLQLLNYELSVCKLNSHVNYDGEFFFYAKTDEEISLVCKTTEKPSNAIKSEDGYKAIRVVGELDFSLIGIISKITGVLAENGISVFVVSTYNTDYVCCKTDKISQALAVLKAAGYAIIE